MHNFYRIGAAVPNTKVTDTIYNTDNILNLIKKSVTLDIQVLVLPELSITGSTCQDLFKQSRLQQSAKQSLNKILQETKNLDIIITLGMPIFVLGNLYNCGVLINKGKILGIIPKTNITPTEERYFSTNCNNREILWNNAKIPFGNKLIFTTENGLNIALEISNDYDCVIPISTNHSMNGANLILNLNGKADYVGLYENYKNSLKCYTGKNNIAYASANCGYGESTTDFSFNGQCFIFENGTCLSETKTYSISSEICHTEIDLDLLLKVRTGKSNYNSLYNYIPIEVSQIKQTTLSRKIEKNPFIPYADTSKIQKLCKEILDIQKTALAKRMSAANVKKLLIGVSGGLDSTLALICTLFTKDFLSQDRKDIIGITMPGYGTSDRTYNNAKKLMELVGITTKEIPIVEACDLHFKDIEYDKNLQGVTFENAQARERTQILFDIANKENGLLVGTGDFTELALGFATYNGDHMSSYCVNGNIPKTVIREVINYVAELNLLSKAASEILKEIVNTPISPELLPPSETGEIKQKTEEVVGPYALNDFFLYYVLKYGFSSEKIIFLASQAFKGIYDVSQITSTLQTFYKRFIREQFKRSCMPDGPSVFDFSLSPRNGYLAPSDASANIWVE